MELKELNSTSTCKKCGYTPLKVYDIPLGDFKRVYMKSKTVYVGELKDTVAVIPEHIKITCPKCGYFWQEKCADYE